MNIRHAEIGICGLSCLLCPRYQTANESKCNGCKSELRMRVGCPFITCAVKRKVIEFCWECNENETCEKWKQHREIGKKHDSFISYQKIEDNISFIHENGVKEFEKLHKMKEEILKELLRKFNEGRSKTYYCVAATVFRTEELRHAVNEAEKKTQGFGTKEKSRILHFILDEIAEKKQYCLKLRK